MQRPDPIRCTYCETISDWSSERTDATMLGEEYSCPACGGQTAAWAEETNQNLEPAKNMHWQEADPIY